MSHIWFGYFVPSLYGNGPEAILQTLVYGLIALIFVPPIRKWFAREYKKVHDRLDHSHERQEELMRHLKHVIKHSPDIPDLPPKEDQ